MNATPPRILHLTESLARLGGVEIFVNDWVRTDAGSAAIALLDSQSSLKGQDRLTGLRPSRLHSVQAMRKRARNLKLRCETLLCHNFAGLTSFSDLIDYERLVVCLHTNSADVWPRLRRLAPFVDGFLTSGKDLAEKARELLGGSQIVVAPFESSLDDSFFCARREAQPNKPIRVGFAGRLVVNQKRVDRLKPFCKALRSRGVDFRLQITGDGPDKAMLEALLGPFPVDFLGLLPREKVAETLAKWDFQIITSDYETGPAVALEGMACGVIPILPEMQCQVLEVLGGKFDSLLYPVGQMEDAAARLQTLSQLPPPELEALRSSLRRLMAPRSMTNFLEAAHRTLAAIRAKPSVRQEAFRFQSSWLDYLPLAVRCRWSGNSEFLK